MSSRKSSAEDAKKRKKTKSKLLHNSYRKRRLHSRRFFAQSSSWTLSCQRARRLPLSCLDCKRPDAMQSLN